MSGYGRTYTDGAPVGRYYDAIRGGWIRIDGPPLISNGRKPNNRNKETSK